MWEYEPNQASFEHLGLQCEIRRVMTAKCGHLCGYVHLPEGHPWWSQALRENWVDAEVHGGITWGPRAEGPRGSDLLGWVGFDCAHGGDIQPWADYKAEGAEYRTFDYVAEECRRLAQSIRGAEEEARSEPVESIRARALDFLGPIALNRLLSWSR